MGIFVGYLLVILWNAYQAEVDKVRLRALAQTRLVAEHATSAFDRANLILIGAEEHLKPVDLRAGVRAPLVRRAEIQRAYDWFEYRVYEGQRPWHFRLRKMLRNKAYSGAWSHAVFMRLLPLWRSLHRN